MPSTFSSIVSHLAGEQLLCYTQNLVLENCTFDRLCDRVFEYSTVEADIRGHIARAININEVCDVNPFAPPSVMAAYDESEEWLDQLCLYIYHNYKALVAFMADRLPQFSGTPLEGTYLAWVDISTLGLSSDALTGQLLQHAHVQVSSGTLYGAAGEGFIRINLACPRAQLMEGLERINNSIKNK